MFLKLLTRGDHPPLHPSSEKKLLSLLGLQNLMVTSRVPGDIAPKLNKKIKFSKEQTIPPFTGDSLLEDFGDSDEEQMFFNWIQKNWPNIA